MNNEVWIVRKNVFSRLWYDVVGYNPSESRGELLN